MFLKIETKENTMPSDSKKSLFNENQKKFIKMLIDEDGEIDVKDAGEKLGISKATIYNYYHSLTDLTFIRNKGKIKLYKPSSEEGNAIDSMYERQYRSVKSKVRAARYVAREIIKAGDVIFLDCGSSNVYLAEQICEHEISDLNIVTINPYVMVRLYKYEKLGQLTVIGGLLNRNTGSFQGAWTEEFLKSLTFQFQKSFIGIDGVTDSGVITIHNSSEINQKRKIMELSQEVYFVSDESKINKGGEILITKENSSWGNCKILLGSEIDNNSEVFKNIKEIFKEDLIIIN